VKLLLDSGANIEAKNNDGNTALISARYTYHGDGNIIVKLLQEAAAKRPQQIAAVTGGTKPAVGS